MRMYADVDDANDVRWMYHIWINDVCSNYRTVNIVFVCVDSKRKTEKKERKENPFWKSAKAKALLAYRNFIFIF